MPTFSIIIPTFNRSAKLFRALESLNRQTLLDFEVIVCDDGSTDDTKDMISGFTPKIKFRDLLYIRQENWGGPARPRNIAVQAAKANWICFLDSDDSWHPEKLASVFPYLNDYDLIYHDFHLADQNGLQKRLRSRNLYPPIFQDLMLQGHNGCIINSGVCVSKAIFQAAGGFSEEKGLIGVEDTDLWLKISRLTEHFFYLDKPLGYYYLEGNNLTVYNQQMIDKLNLLFQKHAPLLPKADFRTLALRTHHYHLGRIYFKMKDYSTALRMHYSSIGSPNPKLLARSIYWIGFLLLRKIQPPFKNRYTGQGL